MSQLKAHKPDYVLLVVILLLAAFGLIAVATASSAISFEKFGHNYYFLNHQLLYGIIPGIALLILFSRIKYHFWQKIAIPMLIISIGLLVLVFIPGLNFEFGGAKRWIDIGPIFFQPTEIVKLTFVIYLAAWFDKKGEQVKSFQYGFLSFIFILGIIAFLVVMQPDIGTLSVIAFSALVVFFVAGARISHLLALLGVAGGLFYLLIKIAPYRLARLTVFMNKELDPEGIGYQVNQALLAIGSGGLWGRGLGMSRQKFNFLPEVTGDSIFAVIVEELGFLRAILIIFLFVVFALKGFMVAKLAPDNFGKYLATGIVAWIIFQAFINIAAMVSLVPLTGIPLPLISYGSSALVVTLASLGILLNISRYTTEPARRTTRRV